MFETVDLHASMEMRINLTLDARLMEDEVAKRFDMLVTWRCPELPRGDEESN